MLQITRVWAEPSSLNAGGSTTINVEVQNPDTNAVSGRCSVAILATDYPSVGQDSYDHGWEKAIALASQETKVFPFADSGLKAPYGRSWAARVTLMVDTTILDTKTFDNIYEVKAIIPPTKQEIPWVWLLIGVVAIVGFVIATKE